MHRANIEWQLENYMPAPEGIMETLLNPPAALVVEVFLSQNSKPKFIRSGLAWLKDIIEEMEEQKNGD